MGVPKKRKTKSKTRSKRSHHALGKILLAKCKECKASVMPHQVCPECGHRPTKKPKITSAKPQATSKSK